MQDDITVLYSEGFEWGEPLPTTDVDMKCYLKWGHHLVKNLAGEDVISRGIAYTMAARTITNADFIEHDSTRYAIIAVVPGKDFSTSHQEVHLQ